MPKRKRDDDEIEDGFYALCSAKNGDRYLDIVENAKGRGVQLSEYQRKWSIEQVDIGLYTIELIIGGTVLECEGLYLNIAGGKTRLWDDPDSKNSRWKFVEL